MWSFESSIETTASPEQIWSLWSDVSSWSSWDPGLDNVTLEGPFQVGSKGKLKPTGGPTLSFELTEVEINRGFSDYTKLLLAKVVAVHKLTTATDGKTIITHRMEIHGPLTPLFRRVIGKGTEKDLPVTLSQLAQRAESLSRS